MWAVIRRGGVTIAHVFHDTPNNRNPCTCPQTWRVHPPFDIAGDFRIGLLILKLDADFEPGSEIFFFELGECLK